ncbi:SDR family NAD(P)-dependent oxidoreductase [Pyxidicoccus fallax]|uniref:SDR family NAD(P)-dependent oxidoreductase n=1 Tax=Pyxidicoccus fallax TaxID=394095 RepID=A0A848LN23_9BACT|nr:SDR family NAD(P)-dependent oxidoreductase [Pyxidicoccus fallax]NMO19136.1 SDR family NAD(P)-dependent oxidoreductase [Pyxidicoccus fallax]NPC82130.1 SDR family NAD(P)-dependent oxidoreductase [Pyxidicoccus fallax]
MKAVEQDRTALVTGASSGIGLELTRRLLSEGWQVIALNRSGFPQDDSRLQEAQRRGQLRVYRADLADFGSVRQAVAQLQAAEEKVDVLFNNAGGTFPELTFSPQGRELHFELQTVVPYILLMELKALLLRGTLKTVVHTSSEAFRFVRRFEPDTLERPATFKKLTGPYATTKLALTLWTRELGPRLAAEGIRLLSVDPGGNNTLRRGKDSGLPLPVEFLMRWFFPPPSHGASLLYEAAVGAHGLPPGAYVSKGAPKELRFREHGRSILERVRAIHEREYLGAADLRATRETAASGR